MVAVNRRDLLCYHAHIIKRLIKGTIGLPQPVSEYLMYVYVVHFTFYYVVLNQIRRFCTFFIETLLFRCVESNPSFLLAVGFMIRCNLH